MTRPDPRDFETPLTRPAGRVMTREKPCKYTLMHVRLTLTSTTSIHYTTEGQLTALLLARIKKQLSTQL